MICKNCDSVITDVVKCQNCGSNAPLFPSINDNSNAVTAVKQLKGVFVALYNLSERLPQKEMLELKNHLNAMSIRIDVIDGYFNASNKR